MILSGEQSHIRDCIKQGKHVIVQAVAGSGKSSTVLSIAEEMTNKKILQFTYNSSLRTEIKEKVSGKRLSNITIHTYHSLAVRYYLPTAYTDTGIRHILYNDLQPVCTIPLYDILVIDETQDMTLLYFQLTVKFIRDMCSATNHRVQLLILGDELQSLYEFKGADARFLTLAHELWQDNPFLITREFMHCTMRMSYRITNQIGSFVNEAMLGESRMDACRDGPLVKYIRNSRTNLEKNVIFEVNRLLSKGALPSDIFIIGASVKSAKSNIRRMENVLVSQGIPCHVPMLENENIDDRVIGGKIVFTTFHCVKGRQRPYVFIVGFDNSYLDFYARTLAKDRCPNTLYVGATRASEELFLLESDNYTTDRPLPFLKINHHEMRTKPYIQFKGQPRSIFYACDRDAVESIQLVEKHYETPTNMIKFIPESVIEEISPLLDRIFVLEQAIQSDLPIPSVIETKQGFFEEVSDLNGITIPILYYQWISGLFSVNDGTDSRKPNLLLDLIRENIHNMKAHEHVFLRDIVEELPENNDTMEHMLYLSNVYVATQEKLYFKLKQIDRSEYTWLTNSMFEHCKERIHLVIGPECITDTPIIEETIIEPGMEEEHAKIDAHLAPYFENKKFRFTARIDLRTEQTIWELKCCSQLSMDHRIQVVIYAWLWNVIHEEKKEFRLMNIKTGEIMVLRASMEELTHIVVSILQGKYLEHEPLTDEEFIQECKIANGASI
jgi:hypothetical protein